MTRLVALSCSLAVLTGCTSLRSDPAHASHFDAPDSNSIRFRQQDGRIWVLAGGELFTAFHFAREQKPCLYPVVGPGGVHVTRAWPLEELPHEDHDHDHHTSLWFAHGDVNGHDFWHAGAKRARVEYGGVLLLDDAAGTITSTHDWKADGALICTESRRMTFHASADERAIDFEITLHAENAPLRFGDTKEGMFALRLTPMLRVRGDVAQGSSLNSEGDVDGACWGKRARWVSYSGPAPIVDAAAGDSGTAEVSVALFDHPKNRSHPTWWHARTYGLVAANPFGVHDFEGLPAGTGDLEIAAGNSITFRYRVLIQRGIATAAALDLAWDRYALR